MNAKLHFTRLLLSLLTLIVVALPGRTPAQAGDPAGTIAYVRPHGPHGDEIHLVEPDGSGDRILFQTNHVLPENLSDIGSLAWKPNAAELAFVGAHENTCSLYESDIYTIRPDGKNYRRITDPPACGQRAGLPTGTVTVPVYNGGKDTVGPFLIYFEGAPGAKSIAVSPGQIVDVTFTNVADYGSQEQHAIWMYFEMRASYPGARVDVVPGTTVRTGTLAIYSSGTKIKGFRWPAYLPGGSGIATIYSDQELYEFAPNGPAVGWNGDKIEFDFNLWGSGLVWSPAPEFADYFLYYGGVDDSQYIVRSSVFLGNVNGEAEEIFTIDPYQEGNTLLGLAWLPDGSGFLYSLKQFIYIDEYHWFQGANLWEYSFETGESTMLIEVSQGFTRQMAVSPDGSKILFEYQASGEWLYPDQIDLYMLDRVTNEITLFAEDARSPAWSLQDIPEYQFVFLPAIRR